MKISSFNEEFNLSLAFEWSVIKLASWCFNSSSTQFLVRLSSRRAFE